MELMIAVAVIMVKVVLITVILFIVPVPLTWLERKIAGHIQQRMGPMRVGWHGLLQPVADGLKLLTKEDNIPDQSDRVLFKIAPFVALVPPFMVFVAVPFGDDVSIWATRLRFICPI